MVSPGCVMMFAAYTTGPVKAVSAAGTPAPRSAGMALVNRLPGLSTTTSACLIDRSRAGGGAAPEGSIATRRTAHPALLSVDSPRVTDLSTWWATSATLSVVAGYTLPLIRRNRPA